MPLQGAIQWMLREGGLHQHFARLVRPPGTARHLHQLRKQLFPGAEVATVQRAVGIQHPHQRQIREVVSLHQHLRADQNIHLVGANLRLHVRPSALALGAVPIDAQNARLRKTLLQHLFHALGAAAQWQQFGVTTVRAGRRHAAVRTAVVAAQAVLVKVQHHFPGAVAAAGQPATFATAQHRRIAPAVDEQ